MMWWPSSRVSRAFLKASIPIDTWSYGPSSASDHLLAREAVFHVKHEGWTPQALAPPQHESLRLYEELLISEAVPRGMVAASDSGHLRDRHILDSLRAVAHLPAGAETVVDLGSGAGFPGLPIAVARPDLAVTLTESRQTRAAFLELAVERLRLANVRVFPGAAENLAPGIDVCLARGFADVSRTWEVARPLLDPRGALLYWAGKSFTLEDVPAGISAREVTEATLESGGPIVIMTQQ
jgi:16S rRNA (guanine(527)-N(7))-methyltransferase RsmG